MKINLITICIILLYSVKVYGQIGDPPPMALSSTPTSISISESVLEAQHMDTQVTAMFNEVFNVTAAKLPAEKKQKLISIAKDFIAKYNNWNELKNPIAEMYARVYTISELKQLLTFYKTPLGQKLAQNQNIISEQIQALVAQTVSDHQQELIDKLK